MRALDSLVGFSASKLSPNFKRKECFKSDMDLQSVLFLTWKCRSAAELRKDFTEIFVNYNNYNIVP